MIAIIGAMEEEVQALVERMEKVQHHQISNIQFYQGQLSQVSVIVMQSGVAKVAAALSTTVLMEHFDISMVINIGTAGGLLNEEEVLDVVVSTVVAHHDIDVTPFGWPKGFDQEKTCYKADEKLIQIMTDIIQEDDRVFVGPIASGDSFIWNDDQVQKILKEYPGALCAEMEAAAIAQVCRHYQKPFVVIRSLSDITLRNDSHLTFDEYVVLASKRSALWCDKFVQAVLSEGLVTE